MGVYEKGNSELNSGDLTQTEAHLYGSSRAGLFKLNRNVENPEVNTTDVYEFERGNKVFELSNHLGNVLATVSDRKLGFDEDADEEVDGYVADVVSANDYYPFGMMMPGRRFSPSSGSGAYRYGFNGKEKDNDMSSLTAYDYGFRIYNPAIGKFLSVDPLIKDYPELTPYQFASNTPIESIDLDGLERASYGLYLRTAARATTSLAKKTAAQAKVSVQSDPNDPFGQRVTDPLGKGQAIPAQAVPFLNSAGQTIAYSVEDHFFVFRNDAVDKSGRVGFFDLEDPSYDYAEDYYGKKNNPRSWGIAKGLKKIGQSYIDWGNDPVGTTKNAIIDTWEGVKNFDLQKTIEHVSSLDKSDQYCLATTLFLGSIKTPIPNGATSKVLMTDLKQLQKKFKHALDFGVQGNYSKANALSFFSALNKHINNADVKMITGTYKGQPAIHYFNTKTNVNVISYPSGEFWSGWKLSTEQAGHLLKHGGLR